ncbi:hypothetical protein Tco_1554529 [Tanacetum coccineum]
MGIRHAKPYTLRDRPSTKLEQRLFKACQLNNHSKNSSISSKPGRAHICTINNQSIDLNITDDEEDEYIHEDEYVHTDDNEDTESNNGNQEMNDAEKNNDNKAEEERDTFYEPAQNEQAVDYQEEVFAPITHKDKPNLVESTEAEITSLLDVQVHQEILAVLSAPLLDVIYKITFLLY